MRHVMLERHVEEACRKIAKAHGLLFLKWVSPGTSGVHDRLLVVEGRLIPIEIKSLSGKLSALQKRFHADLEARGVEHYTVRTPEQFEKVLAKILGSTIAVD